MKYRPEIDGLRAIAVIPVILFHAGLTAFSGGFVGVDVFFVISGFLITTILHSEIQAGSFSIINFYDRRIRRLLPALFFVCLICCIFAWQWMMPPELVSFGRSLVAVNLYVSNIFFWKEVGYFTAGVELKPLLHTWSLAVEEQFYVVFPLLLLMLRKISPKNLLTVITCLVLASFCLSVWASYQFPRSNFYWLPTRAWEMGVGSILALTAPRWSGVFGWKAQLASVIGLALIVYAIISYDSSTLFPGIWALAPVIGSALIIAYTRTESVTGRILSWSPIRYIGLISYSAYLWHWPLFVFARIYFYDSEVPSSIYLMLSVLTLILAYVSWRFIEGPFRDKTRFSRKFVFTLSAVISVSFIGFGLAAHISKGFPERHPQPLLAAQLSSKLQANHGLAVFCNPPGYDTPMCQTSEQPEVMVWGDSYAMHLVDGLIASKSDIKLVQFTKSVCGPFFDLAPILSGNNNRAWAKECVKFNETVQTYLLRTPSVKYAVLSSPFGQYSADTQTFLDKGMVVEQTRDYAIQRFQDTLDWLQANNIRPVVVSPPPKNGKNIGNCLARSLWLQKDSSVCQISKQDYETHETDRIAFLKAIDTNNDVIWLSDYLCNDGDCATNFGDSFVYRDTGHLSREGAKLIGKRIEFYNRVTAP